MKTTSRDVVTVATPPAPGRTGLVIDLGDEEDRAYLRDAGTSLPDVVVGLLATDAETPAWLDALARELGSRCVLVVVRTPPRTGPLAGRPRSARWLGATVDEAFRAAGGGGPLGELTAAGGTLSPHVSGRTTTRQRAGESLRQSGLTVQQ